MITIFKPQWIKEGPGATVLKIIGNQLLPSLDPFVMLQFFKLKLPAGFPDHPHRGFEAVTYMIEGNIYDEDFLSNRRKVGPGDIQWLTAGKGFVHSQFPSSFDQAAVGFQLWINLSKENKMSQPACQDIVDQKLVVHHQDKADIKILSGKWKGKTGPIFARTPTYFFDISLEADGKIDFDIASSWNSFVFPYKGEIKYQNQHQISQLNCCILDKGISSGNLNHSFISSHGAKFILIAGQPLNEPMKSRDDFVMNTQEELDQSQLDFKNKVNGFQAALSWESTIKQLKEGKNIEDLWK